MGLFSRGVKPDQIFNDGVPATGRIIGIAISEVSGDEYSNKRVDEYALRVDLTPPFVVGVSQVLRPDDFVRLGMEVAVKHLDGKALIDWEATCGGHVAAAGLLKEPPAEGVSDSTIGVDKARKKGVPGRATITSAEVVDGMMGLTQVLSVELTVEPDGLESYDSTVKGLTVPHYATHLAEVGTVLPAWIDARRLDKVTIDWPAAVVADPGVGRPPAEILSLVGNVFTDTAAPTSAMSAIADDRPIASDVSPEHTPIDGVTFDAWVAVTIGSAIDRVPPADIDAYAEQFGAAPGAYTAAADAWMKRTYTDWRLGAAYGEACEAERKRRKK